MKKYFCFLIIGFFLFSCKKDKISKSDRVNDCESCVLLRDYYTGNVYNGTDTFTKTQYLIIRTDTKSWCDNLDEANGTQDCSGNNCVKYRLYCK